jgi:multidrug efflux pump subunit AcrA (membrane-fusion protein)
VTRRAIVAVAFASLVIFAGCGRERAESADETARIPVRVHAVEHRDLARTITLSGRLRASERVEIQPKVSGRILAFPHDEGETVEVGDTVAELDPTEHRLEVERAAAAVAQAEARLEEAERALARARELFEQHVMSRAALDGAEVEARIARADLKTARASRNLAAQRLEDTRVTAPIAGVLQERGYSVGDIVGPSFGGGGSKGDAGKANRGNGGGGGPIFTLIQLDPLEIEFNVAEQDLPYVQHTESAIPIEIDVYPDREWVGHVAYIAPSLHPQAHTQLIRLRVANADGLLKPGMFARMVGTREVAEDALVVRADSLMNLGGSYGAFVVNGDGTAHLRRLEVAFVTENQAAVIAGLEVGESVVFEGQSNLRDGAAVRIVAPEGAATEPEPPALAHVSSES